MTKKLTLNLTEDAHERLSIIAETNGCTSTDMIRRAIGLLSIVHTLTHPEDMPNQDLYVCTSEDGELKRHHTIDSLSF